MTVMGIDIGTTSISAAVVDTENNKIQKTFTVPYDCTIKNIPADLYEQDPDQICTKAMGLISDIFTEFPDICSIGVTGQMHGMLYINSIGEAVSPLVTWQDRRGDRTFGEKTYCETVFDITNESIYTGYGLLTHYYNLINGTVPDSAVTFCSIMDYLVMRLTDNTVPIIHDSVAASFGFFDVRECRFKEELIQKIGISNEMLPKVTDDFYVCGKYGDAAVTVAIGDNQASFLGSVKDTDKSVLVNIGTGSQISAVAGSPEADGSLEVRPLVKGKFLVCGSALCGGSAYALLEKFFREYAIAAVGDDSSQYDTINKLAYDAYQKQNTELKVNTYFKGKRSDPILTGSVIGITTENFTPGNLALGFLQGICDELYSLFKDDIKGKTSVIASGNAVQKVEIFKEIISDTFSLPVFICATKEEASVGAALFSAISAGFLKDIYCFSDYIKYN